MESRDGIPDPANRSNTAPPQPPPLSGVQEATNNGNGRIIPVIRYRDCLKNHAASIGGHAVDGCGEFLPACGEEGTTASLTCAACNCHRNFHRREESDGNGNNNDGRGGSGGYTANLYRPPPPRQHHLTATIRHSPNHHYIYGSTAAAATSPSPSTPSAPVMMNFSRDGGATAESSSEGFSLFQSNITGETSNSNKKRFRTIFTNSQKEMMHDFAEKLGWKIQRQDEQQVQQFCNVVGIKRQVFKVWMHNNKQAIKKKEL